MHVFVHALVASEIESSSLFFCLTMVGLSRDIAALQSIIIFGVQTHPKKTQTGPKKEGTFFPGAARGRWEIVLGLWDSRTRDIFSRDAHGRAAGGSDGRSAGPTATRLAHRRALQPRDGHRRNHLARHGPLLHHDADPGQKLKSVFQKKDRS